MGRGGVGTSSKGNYVMRASNTATGEHDQSRGRLDTIMTKVIYLQRWSTQAFGCSPRSWASEG